MKVRLSVTSVVVSALAIVAATGSGAEIVVRSDGAVRTLSEALRLARDGDRIVVHPGRYREGTIVVDRSVEIVGKDFPVFDGEDVHTVIAVRANNVTIKGLEIANVGVSYVEDHAGIKLEDAHGCVIEGNRLRRTFFGIYLAKSSNTRIVGNDILGEAVREASSGNAVHLWYCRDVFIEGNHIRGHRDGIYLEWVIDSSIEGNVSEDNLRYGLHFMFSNGSVYRRNVFRRNGAGVAVMYTKNVRMIDNLMEHNWGPVAYGLLLKDIADSYIAQNRFSRNTVGLYSEGSSRITIERNEFTQNGWAVRIMANSVENHFAANNFIANSFDVATNSRQTFSTFEGNYWSAYRGYDLTGDGYGDVPYRPVRLFSYVVERHPPTLILLRSLFIDLLDLAERVLPTLTPESLVDRKPAMQKIR